MDTNLNSPKVERRHHQRVAFNSDATLQTIGAKPISVRTRNISVGGLSVLTSQDLATDTRCKIHVAIPDGSSNTNPVELVARVVSCNYNKIEGGFMLGCEFVNLTANVAATIARFMHSR
ncbi:MAG: PilZ domain [Pseudomonadota bacterium]|jgi:c-di-GMP-binding flagellar brake protein YcgR